MIAAATLPIAAATVLAATALTTTTIAQPSAALAVAPAQEPQTPRSDIAFNADLHQRRRTEKRKIDRDRNRRICNPPLDLQPGGLSSNPENFL